MSSSKLGRYLFLNRHGTFYARVCIPVELQPALGRREVRRSLGTSVSLKVARERADRMGSTLTKAFANLMSKPKAPRITEHNGVALNLGIEELKIDHLGNIVSATGINATTPADIAFLKELFASNVRTAPDLYDPPPADPVLAPLPAPGVSYQAICDSYMAEHGTLTKKSQQEIEAVLARYGASAGAAWASKSAAVKFKDAEMKRLAPRTLNKVLTRMQSLFTWAVNHGHVSDNVFAGLKPRRQRSTTKRDIWSHDDLAIMFSAAAPDKDPRHWMPILGAFTGARVNELAQLRCSDVIADPVPHLRITDEGEGMRVKNVSSKRVVPLHSMIAAHLLAYRDSRVAAGHEFLFGWRLGRDGRGQAASRWFQRWRKQHGIEGVFHELRNTVATKLREADIPETVAAEILGHSLGERESYGTYARAASLQKLAAAIEKLQYV